MCKSPTGVCSSDGEASRDYKESGCPDPGPDAHRPPVPQGQTCDVLDESQTSTEEVDTAKYCSCSGGVASQTAGSGILWLNDLKHLGVSLLL